MALVQTLVVDNFKGSMTPYLNGDINSGYANVLEVFGNDPFSLPGKLTWSEQAVRVDPTESVITDLILSGKVRLESGITYTYAIGHTGRLYKIQSNDPTTYNPDYDNPVLIATLSAQTPTFTKGGFIDFFGATEQIYIGHDKGVTRINFDGTGETFVGVLGSWKQNVPRPLKQFLGKLMVGNGDNLAEIDSTATVSTYAKLSPSFPTSSQTRDLDVTPDGNYLQSVVDTSTLGDVTSTSPDTTLLTPSDSFIFRWNGTDTGYTAFTSYPSTLLTANMVYGSSQYVAGYDVLGGSFYSPLDKLLTSTSLGAYTEPVSANAFIPVSNLLTIATPLYFVDHLEMTYCVFGTPSSYEIEPGYWATFGLVATDTETDIVRVPCQILVSNFAIGASSNNYAGNVFGNPKIYFSTLETSDAPTTKYKLYKWNFTPTGNGVPIEEGVYQTQTQLFSKKIKVSEVRVYGEPWVANNSFQIDLIGSGGTPIQGSTQLFTAGTNLTIGDDYAWYSPPMEPTYAIGLRITQMGTKNFVINKVEIDYTGGGK